MRRVLGLDVLKCDRCGSRRRLIAVIDQHQREVIVKLLEHLGLPSAAPQPAPARPPPQLELGY